MNDFDTDPSQTLPTPEPLSRRQLLRAGALGLTAASFGGIARGARAQRPQAPTSDYSPFTVGIQSYSLRGYSFEEALQRTAKLNLNYWEAFPDHIPLTDSPIKRKEILDQLKAVKVQLWGWGVQSFDSNEASARKKFEFAKAMGIRVISADPAPESLPILDKLVQQYKINIAIHNHGPGARYDKIVSVANAIEGHHPRIGACVDTGHYLRSGEDPTEAVKTFGKRTYLIHLKDVKNRTEFTEIGQGDLNPVKLFRALLALNYRALISLEYEEHPDNPGPYLSLCLTATQDAITKAIRQ